MNLAWLAKSVSNLKVSPIPRSDSPRSHGLRIENSCVAAVFTCQVCLTIAAYMLPWTTDKGLSHGLVMEGLGVSHLHISTTASPRHPCDPHDRPPLVDLQDQCKSNNGRSRYAVGGQRSTLMQFPPSEAKWERKLF